MTTAVLTTDSEILKHSALRLLTYALGDPIDAHIEPDASLRLCLRLSRPHAGYSEADNAHFARLAVGAMLPALVRVVGNSVVVLTPHGWIEVGEYTQSQESLTVLSLHLEPLQMLSEKQPRVDVAYDALTPDERLRHGVRPGEVLVITRESRVGRTRDS